MKNLFNNFIKDVLRMALEDPPTGNGGTGTGTGNNSGGNGGVDDTEDLKNDTENPEGNTTVKPGSGSASSSGGGITDDGRPLPDVGVGAL
jgi:hypothetical protein